MTHPNRLHIYGNIQLCYNHTSPKASQIKFKSNDGKIYEVQADKKGYYSIFLDDPIFEGEIIAESLDGDGGKLTIEDIFIGYTNRGKLDIDLYIYNGFFVNEIELKKMIFDN